MSRQRRWTEAELAQLQGAPGRPQRTLGEVERAFAAAERTKLEDLLAHQLSLLNLLVLFEREARFHVERKWRLDFLARALELGIEVHGGTFIGGRHTTGKGFQGDRQKINAAIEAGIAVLEYDAAMVKSGEAALQVERVVKKRVG